MFRILSKGSLHAIEMQWICTNDADGQTVKSKEELQYILEMLFMYGTKVVLRGPSVETVAYYTLQYFIDISEVGPEPSDVETVIKNNLQTFYEDSELDVNTQLMDIHKTEGAMARLPIWAAYHSKSKHSDKCSYLSMSTFRREIDYAVRSNRYNDIIVTLNRGRILNTTERSRLFDTVPEVVFIPEDTVDIGANAFKFTREADCNIIESVNIPEGVEFIGANAFRLSKALTQLIIPNSVTRIDHDAFRNCSHLTVITIPNSVKHVGQTVFKGCGKDVEGQPSVSFKLGRIIESVRMIDLIDGPGLERVKDVTILDGVSAIASKGFEDCTNLQSVSMPLSVHRIAESAFNNCNSLTHVTIPDNVTSIERGAFYHCTKLRALTIGRNVNYIGEHAFSRCFSDSSYVHLHSPDSRISVSIPGNVKTLDRMAFLRCEHLYEAVIHEGTQSLGAGCFYECTDLECIHIPNSLTYIGNKAFEGCKAEMRVHISDLRSWCTIEMATRSSNPLCSDINLEYDHGITSTIAIEGGSLYLGDQPLQIFEIPDTLEDASVSPEIDIVEIPECRFFRCASLQEVFIPPSVKSIGNDAFRLCSNLAKIHISKNVTSIGRNAFAQCTSLKYIDVVADNPKYTAYQNVLYNKEKSKLIQYNLGRVNDAEEIVTEFFVPNTVTIIGESAFANCEGLERISMQKVKTIEQNAFSDCKHLWELISISSVVTIGEDAFFGTALQEVTLPKSVVEVGPYAFGNCTDLTKVTISSKSTKVARNAFWGCITAENWELHVPSGYDTTQLDLPSTVDIVVDVTSG